MTFRLLALEDEVIQGRIMERFFEKKGHRIQLIWRENGLQGQAFINQCNPTRLPDAILLDLNMAPIGGLEFLNWLRSHPNAAVRATPVIVFTTSTAPLDAVRAYSHTIAAYIPKDQKLLHKLETIYNFLTEILPRGQATASQPYKHDENSVD